MSLRITQQILYDNSLLYLQKGIRRLNSAQIPVLASCGLATCASERGLRMRRDQAVARDVGILYIHCAPHSSIPSWYAPGKLASVGIPDTGCRDP